ncbi:hypothetical protein E2562_027654 [Oryza meyeriana var. granulata]|uniref:Uncharacterized protein n=1 Tax=Oryza meyeriana var. granulata TaxID=110450 RepID=A0A6G1E2J5_9ORYZ|nr:hypothetical protein E2562_027654 [Oryza meyeriana var. granulata]
MGRLAQSGGAAVPGAKGTPWRRGGEGTPRLARSGGEGRALRRGGEEAYWCSREAVTEWQQWLRSGGGISLGARCAEGAIGMDC